MCIRDSDYGLEQISIEEEGKEPDPRHLKKIVDIVREKKILRKYKQKAKELLCSEEGLKHRGQRCI